MIPLSLLPGEEDSRVKRDRLELLTALITAPGFDPLYRADVIIIPPEHPVYAWGCVVDDCERVRRAGSNLCHSHARLWTGAQRTGISRAEFLKNATGLPVFSGLDLGQCRICPDRPATSLATRLCDRHQDRWRAWQASQPSGDDDFQRWLRGESALPGYGTCRTEVCPDLAVSPLGLCEQHRARYIAQGRPGNATLPPFWDRQLERRGLPVPVRYDDATAFRRWCATVDPIYRIGVISLLGLKPLIKAEIQWGLYAHDQIRNRSVWEISSIQRLVNYCRRNGMTSLFQLEATGYEGLNLRKNSDAHIRMISGEITAGLRCVYYSPADTKDAGFIETDHFGRRFQRAQSTFDLTSVSQRWLRDLLWDHLAEVLRSVKCPRSRGPFDNLRRGAVELSAFLEFDAPQGGHDPIVLREEHAQRFVADQRHRQRHGLPSLAVTRKDGEPSAVTDVSCRVVLNSTRKLLYGAFESGAAARLGLDQGFIAALPNGGTLIRRSRSPFTDEVARALADEENLRTLDGLDPRDHGVRDVWETIVATGRRCGEVLTLRLDCLGRYGSLPMLWHDQTKVGNFNEAIRIPETLYARLDERRGKTLTRFEHRHGRLPTGEERAAIALFPSRVRNPNEDQSISYGFFSRTFRSWVDGLELGKAVAHQARHTLATNLLRAGASLAHIRRYLGQVSDRMAEHYTKVAHSDLEDVLHAVWVAGPGAPTPGELLSGESAPLSRDQALALALDLSRRSTPADGGFCTFQPVVDGGACPWKLDCENCDKFVLSGADLLYWRRKQEQWRSLAERAPDDATADYLHQVFEPTARAIEGLEKALAGLGLLEEALKLDLRRPQDYFHRVWSTNFRAADLARLDTLAEPDAEDEDEEGAA